MNRFLPLLLSLLVLLTSCTREENAVGLLPKEERAPQFDRVSNFLDLGGVFYAYMDLTLEAENLGRVLTDIATKVRTSMPNVPALPLDFEKFMDATGFSGLDAVGMSSRELEDGYFHNRSILFFPEGVSGFFKVFGEMPHPFDSLDLAPATADLVAEISYRPGEIRNTVLAIGDSLAGAFGRGVIEAQLARPVPELGFRSPDQLIDSIGNRIIVILDFHADESLPGGPWGSVPKTDILVAIDGITDLVESLKPTLEQHPSAEWVDTDTGFEIRSNDPVPPPYDYLQPIIVADTQTKRLFLTTNRAYLEECLQNANKLKNTDEFRQAANLLPSDGVLFSYVSPEYSETVIRVMENMVSQNPMLEAEFIDFIKMLVPSIPRPIASVTTVGPEGLYTASNLNYSHRTTVASLAVQPVAIAGMMSAMAIPAFQKVRSTSQEKTIMNNLRQFASGGQQFVLEEGAREATYSDIVPEYISTLNPVDGEDYTGLVVRSIGGTLSVTTQSGKTVEYTY